MVYWPALVAVGKLPAAARGNEKYDPSGIRCPSKKVEISLNLTVSECNIQKSSVPINIFSIRVQEKQRFLQGSVDVQRGDQVSNIFQNKIFDVDIIILWEFILVLVTNFK